MTDVPPPETAAEREVREARESLDRAAAEFFAAATDFQRLAEATADCIRSLQAREAATASTKGNRRD